MEAERAALIDCCEKVRKFREFTPQEDARFKAIVREAIDRETADLRAENERLKAELDGASRRSASCRARQVKALVLLSEPRSVHAERCAWLPTPLCERCLLDALLSDAASQRPAEVLLGERYASPDPEER